MVKRKEKKEIVKSDDVGQVDLQKRAMDYLYKLHYVVGVAIKVSNNPNDDEFTLQKVLDEDKKISEDLFQSLGAENAHQTMLVTQMATVHKLLQEAYFRAATSNDPQSYQIHINSVIKLSNVFIQQATLLEKLQGKGQQKVIVEHVNVHDGGQAIVGNVETGTQGGRLHGKEKK